MSGYNSIFSKPIISIFSTKNRMDQATLDGEVGQNTICLVTGDDKPTVTEVKYDNDLKKIYYVDDLDSSTDIISISAIKSEMNLPSSALSGSYNDLQNKPSINGIQLTGNKTTTDLGISYNDLLDQPTIPQLTTSYNASDKSKALTGYALSNALNGYVISSRTVTGTGALQGGGDLTRNRAITHKYAPTGLETSAVKIGVDDYGHVQMGSPISPYDVDAQSATYSFQTSLHGMDARFGSIIVLSEHEEETWQTDFQNERGQKIDFTWVNMLDVPIRCTIPYPLSQHSMVFRNGVKMESPEILTCEVGHSRRFSLLCVDYNGDSIVFIDDYYYDE